MKTMLKRGAGVLMPIFSLPSPYGIGTFGRAAYEFIDQFKNADARRTGRCFRWDRPATGTARTSPTLHLREIRILLIWIR